LISYMLMMFRFEVDAAEDFKEYMLRDYYCWLKTYCCWYKLKLLYDVVDIKLRLLEQSVAAEAVNTACYVLNRVLVTKPQNKTPYEVLTVDAAEDFKEYMLRDYYCWLKTYCCWYKLKLLYDVVDIKLRLLEQSVAAVSAAWMICMRIDRNRYALSFNANCKPIGKEFKNNELIELCGLKRIKREYSNARTPQQNGVAERKNRTIIEAARTIQPIISYLRPFGCHVTILNTIDQLGKFDGKSDLGFLVGYFLNSKAFKMFDLDYLTNSINYEPVSVEDQANNSAGPKEANISAGTQANDDQGANSEEIDLHEEHFILPIWSPYSTIVKSSGDKIEKN
nr:hypothetical protein [Tanacetum cinerariifolium]